MMDLKEKLSTLIGDEKVSVSEEDLDQHSIDKWFHRHAPEVVVFAESTDDVSAVLGFAQRHSIPVTPRGAGVGYVGGAVPVRGGISLSVARMTQIKEISAADGIAVVEPGVITGDLLAAAREVGFFYPPDPASLKECSIGGNVATNAGGPRCLKYGVTRHYILGLEVVLADGTVAKLGGRCHKNKTGFDLIGMFVGSEGMLGIITEITTRLIPNPPARAMLSAGFAEFSQAAAAVDGVLGAGFLPAALEISDKFTLAAARAHVGGELVPRGEAHVLVELDGQPDSVLLDCRALERKLGELGALGVSTADTEDGCEALWDIRRAFSYSLRATGLTKLNEDIVVPRGKLTELVDFCEGLQDECGFPIACFGHAGDGNIHVNIMVDDIDDPAVRARSEEALDQLFREVLRLGGTISGEHGIGVAKKRWFADAVDDGAIDLHHRLKKALDPSGILNPGKFLD